MANLEPAFRTAEEAMRSCDCKGPSVIEVENGGPDARPGFGHRYFLRNHARACLKGPREARVPTAPGKGSKP